jgi:signal transduction histidine kinase
VVLASIPSSSILGPLYQIQRSYWLFVLLLTLATGLAFSVMLGGVIRSLEQLTRAAERIGDGELNPWLPPPGDDEVGRLSFAFGQMLDRIRQMIQRIDQEGRLAVVGRLTSYLAHEIRNPLSSIRLNLQTLERDFRTGEAPGDAVEAVDICLREVDRLSNSVNRVLRLGGASSNETTREIGIHDVVQDVALLLSEQCEKAGVVVRLELDAEADRVVAAPGQLKGVFLNLFMNAVEAQPHGGEIVVRSRLHARRGQGPTLVIQVRDTGPGVPPELRDRVFEPFFTTKSDGSGIGLAAAQRAVRENGGDLYLGDLAEVLPGAEFVVELPLAAREPTANEPRRILLPEWMKAEAGARSSPPLGEPEPHGGLP